MKKSNKVTAILLVTLLMFMIVPASIATEKPDRPLFDAPIDSITFVGHAIIYYDMPNLAGLTITDDQIVRNNPFANASQVGIVPAQTAVVVTQIATYTTGDVWYYFHTVPGGASYEYLAGWVNSEHIALGGNISDAEVSIIEMKVDASGDVWCNVFDAVSETDEWVTEDCVELWEMPCTTNDSQIITIIFKLLCKLLGIPCP